MSDKNTLAPGALSFSSPEQKRAFYERRRVDDILRGAEKDPSFIALQSYLQARNATPEIGIGYAGGNMASFKKDGPLGGSLPKNGRIELGYDYASPSPLATNLVVHETTHAADDAMSRQFEQRVKEMGSGWRNIPAGVNQFVDAYRKMNMDPSNLRAAPRQSLAAQVNPEWLKDKEDYRATRIELPAHGLGNMAGPTTLNPAPPHIDAGAATDFMVLLELAQRDAGKTQGPAPGILDRFMGLFGK